MSCIFIFKRLETNLLTLVIYHSQTDDQSKCTNQTVKITLWYYFTSNFSKVFINILLYLQDSLNNAKNIFTDYVCNELVYEFHTNDILDALLSVNLSLKDYTHLWQIYHKKTEQAIVFVNVMMKHYYNTKHIFLIIDQLIYLRLHHSYIISDLLNHKLSNQCISSFRILHYIDSLAYELELLSMMWIHLVILIAQLELTSSDNSYDQQSNVNSSLIMNKNINRIFNNINTTLFYKIKCLLDKHITHHECGQSTVKYLVKWKKYYHSHNIWYKVKDLANARKLVKEYE